MIDFYKNGIYSNSTQGPQRTFKDWFDDPTTDLKPGTKIVLKSPEELTEDEYKTHGEETYSFWVGDATPYQQPSDNDGEIGWDYDFEYNDWIIYEVWSNS